MYYTSTLQENKTKTIWQLGMQLEEDTILNYHQEEEEEEEEEEVKKEEEEDK